MFKNALIYRISEDWEIPPIQSLEDALQGDAFHPCGPTQELAAGWIAPRKDEAAGLAEVVDGQLILKLFVERKAVPGSAIKHELEARCKKIEQETGRVPGRKEKKDLKEEIRLDLLPRAFSKRSQCMVWIDSSNKMLIIGTSSQSMADVVLTQLSGTLAAAASVLEPQLLSTAMSPAAAMSLWLTTREAPYNFTVDRECELKQPDSEQSVVKYSRHNLEIDEIAAHMTAGKSPTKLAMTWDKKVAFVLTDKLQLTKIEFLNLELGEGADSGFDADAAIATGGLSAMIPDLIDALGGLQSEDGTE